MQIGEISGERDIFNERAVGAISRRRDIDRAALPRPLAHLAENLSSELNLRVRFQNLLAGAQGFGAGKITLDKIDKLVVEIAVVHRRDEREHRDEHRKVGYAV